MNTRSYHGRMQGPVVFKKEASFYGRLDGDASVTTGTKLRFHGIMIGDLIIEPEATVELRGRVHGSVLNRGRLVVYGQVDGIVQDEGGQTTMMWPNAVLSWQSHSG